ncbi:hypothetical protein BJY04DRAFT_31066 [Aspergillus karnatakaensis]|uniref:uncharacterized protein n=1 Tax=Aspergillus karnatakaensis TaxID=1810916 RepID=UPI003CCCCB3B
MTDDSYFTSRPSNPVSPTTNHLFIHTHPVNAANFADAYTGFDADYIYPNISDPSLATFRTEGHSILYHDLNNGPAIFQPTNQSLSNPPSESDSESHTDMHSHSVTILETTPITANNSMLCAKRRLQNRAAQRRFRQRKEDQQKIFAAQIDSLEQKCQEVTDRLDAKAEEAEKLLLEKNTLESEVQDLRRRWQVMKVLMQKPNGLQSLSALFADGKTSKTSSSSSTSTSKEIGTQAEAAGEELLRCLDALLPKASRGSGSGSG